MPDLLQLVDSLPIWPVLPVRRVLFPNQTATYAIGRSSSVATINDALKNLGISAGVLTDNARLSPHALLSVVLTRADGASDGIPALHDVATAARLLEVRAAQAGSGSGDSELEEV